jgi:dTDP-4-dehydrorhamnose reductase
MEASATRRDIDLVALGRDQLDLEEHGRASEAVAQLRPDIVINAAAYTAVDQAEDEPKRAFRINASAAGELAAAAARVGAPIIQVSTDYVFDGTREGPYDETVEPNPLSVYGKSKLEGEEQVRNSNPRHLIIRTAWVYSPFGRNFVKTMISAAQKQSNLSVVDDQCGSPSSALALADGILRILEALRARDRELDQVYHLAGTGSASWFQFAREIMDQCKKHGLRAADVQPISTRDWRTKAVRPRNSVLDSRKFEQDFGFAMPPWQESLASVMERLARQ